MTGPQAGRGETADGWRGPGPDARQKTATPRWATPRTPGRPTTGVNVRRMARLLGRPLIPWQATHADVAGELLPSGRFAYPLVVTVVPRRAGKTGLVLPTLLQRAQLERMARQWYTAQRREDAAKVYRLEWTPLVELSPLERKVHVRRAQGSEGFTFRRSRSTINLFPPTQGGLHSQNADTVVIDEAWFFDLDTGSMIEAGARPAQLTRRFRQTWIVTAGGTELSTWLDGWMTLGRAAVDDGATSGICYLEFSADAQAPGYDPADPELWRRVHPGIGHHVPIEAIAEDLTTMDRATFERSYLNVWPRPSEGGAAGIDLEVWAGAGDPDAAPADPVCYAVDVAADRSWSSVAAAGPDRNLPTVVELVEHRRGVDWVAPMLRQLRARHRGARIMADSLVAASIVAELGRAHVAVETVGAAEYARACVTFVDSLAAGALAHRGQLDLDDAVAGAARRNLADAWAWSRSRSTVDISPLVAVTLAAWAHLTRPALVKPQVATS